MSVDELVEYPSFPELQRKVDSAKTFKVLLFIYALLMIPGGLALAIIASSNEAETGVWVGLAVLGAGSLSLVGFRRVSANAKKANLEIASRTSEYLTGERNRLAQVKASMTVAEWETYKLQMENQRLLREIKNKPTGGRSTTTTTTSWVAEISD